jgi:hypothetical protein
MPIFTDEAEITILNTTQRRLGGREAIVYNDDNYVELVNPIKLLTWNDLDTEEVPTKAIRVSLSIRCSIKLGLEGAPTDFIMAHEKLTHGQSLSPGQLFFNAQDIICALSNKSGDFKADFNKMQYLVVKLIVDGKIPFADEITFKKYSIDAATRKIKIESIKISNADLVAEIKELKFYQDYINHNLPVFKAPSSPFSITPQKPPGTPRKKSQSLTPTSSKSLLNWSPATSPLAKTQDSKKRRFPFDSQSEQPSVPTSFVSTLPVARPKPKMSLFSAFTLADVGSSSSVSDLFLHPFPATAPHLPQSTAKLAESLEAKPSSFFARIKPLSLGFVVDEEPKPPAAHSPSASAST